MEPLTREELELQVRRPQPKYPGYQHPLEFRPLKITDTLMLAPVMKRSAPYIQGYVHWGTYAATWNFKQVQHFIAARVNDDFPRMHYLFLIGREPVCLASFAPMASPYDAQIALAVFHPHQGRGIGASVVKTMEWLAFSVWGFETLWYQYDASNKNSQKLANKCGFAFDHSFEEVITAKQETGLWFSHRKDKGPQYPSGVLQGADMEYWTEAHTAKELAVRVTSIRSSKGPSTRFDSGQVLPG